MPDELKWTWPCWRLIAEDKATFTEVTEVMSIVDVMKLNEVISIVAVAQMPPEKK